MKVKGASKLVSSPQTLGARIRVIRKAWGWTQEELAEALRTDRQIVSYWERDISKPSRSAMQLLERLFRLPTEALISGEGFSISDVPKKAGEAKRDSIRDFLPTTKAGRVLIIGAENGKTKFTSFEQAVQRLKLAESDGDLVWLVISNE